MQLNPTRFESLWGSFTSHSQSSRFTCWPGGFLFRHGAWRNLGEGERASHVVKVSWRLSGHAET